MSVPNDKGGGTTYVHLSNEIQRRLEVGQLVVHGLVIIQCRFGEVLFTGDTDFSDVNNDKPGKSYRVGGIIIDTNAKCTFII